MNSYNTGIPDDVKQVSLWIIRGYDRRVKWYKEQRAVAASAVKPEKAAQKLERSEEVKRMKAVEQATVCIATDVRSDKLRISIRKAILLNCRSGRQYPYERLGELGISRSEFYRRKDEFLRTVAELLGMV